MSRVEFSDKVKEEIWRRAGGPGQVRCEGCGWSIRGRNFQVDHCVPEWVLDDIAKKIRGPLTASDGKLLGNHLECGCHKTKTAREAGERAHGKRIVRKAAKAHRQKGRGFSKRFKKCMDGTVVDRETGRPVGDRE